MSKVDCAPTRAVADLAFGDADDHLARIRDALRGEGLGAAS